MKPLVRVVTLTRTFPAHARVYALGALVLLLANWFTGPPWWSFWPLGAWSVALGGHYLVYKTKTVDQQWVDERTADVHSKSYDAGHIDRIAADQDPKAPPRS